MEKVIKHLKGRIEEMKDELARIERDRGISEEMMKCANNKLHAGYDTLHQYEKALEVIELQCVLERKDAKLED